LGLGNYVLSLIAILSGDLPVSSNDLGRRKNLLTIAGIVGCNLRRFRPREPTARDGFNDLLPPWTGGIKVLLRVAFDLGGTATPWLDLVAKSAELVGKVGLVHSGRELLGLKETAWL
jgi:hypothetical protein